MSAQKNQYVLYTHELVGAGGRGVREEGWKLQVGRPV